MQTAMRTDTSGRLHLGADAEKKSVVFVMNRQAEDGVACYMENPVQLQDKFNQNFKPKYNLKASTE